VFAEPFPIGIEARTVLSDSAARASDIVSVRGVEKPGFGVTGNILPLFVFSMAVDKGEAITATIVLPRDI